MGPHRFLVTVILPQEHIGILFGSIGHWTYPRDLDCDLVSEPGNLREVDAKVSV